MRGRLPTEGPVIRPIVPCSAAGRRRSAGIDDAPEYIVLAAAGIGSLGYVLLLIGRNLWVGLSFVQATGADETKKTSKVVLVLAALLFAPLWAISLAMTVKSFGPSSSIQALTVWAFVATFVTLIVFGIVREWRK